MRRYLPAILATLSALTAIYFLIILLGTFNHFAYYPVRLGPLGIFFRAQHGIGDITVFHSRDWIPINSPVDYSYRSLGFGFTRRIAPSYALQVPLAVPILLFLIYPLHFARRTKFFLSSRNERLSENLCPTCAYDLRAHAPGQKCPECGTLKQS